MRSNVKWVYETPLPPQIPISAQWILKLKSDTDGPGTGTDHTAPRTNLGTCWILFRSDERATKRLPQWAGQRTAARRMNTSMTLDLGPTTHRRIHEPTHACVLSVLPRPRQTMHLHAMHHTYLHPYSDSGSTPKTPIWIRWM